MRKTSTAVLSLLFASSQAIKLKGDEHEPTFMRAPPENSVGTTIFDMTQEASPGIAADRSRQLAPTSFV